MYESLYAALTGRSRYESLDALGRVKRIGVFGKYLTDREGSAGLYYVRPIAGKAVLFWQKRLGGKERKVASAGKYLKDRSGTPGFYFVRQMRGKAVLFWKPRN